MFKNLQIYRLSGFLMSAESLSRALAVHAFTPASSNELLREGWASPRAADQLVHAVNGQFLLKLQSEKKLLPATVINQVAAARATEIEEAQGFAPGKKAMKEIRERIADELLPRAFTIKSSTLVWIDPVNGWMVVDAASPAKADSVVKLLLKSVDKLPLESLRMQRSPVGVMTEWLQSGEAPTAFTVDQDATLRATGESKATVQWKRHTLDAAELGRHIAAGKQCVRVAMTWDSKISFVLDESLAVKSVKLLDVLTENDRGTNRNDDERFDGDMMLFTGECAKLLADLVDALGGAAEGDAPATLPPADTAPAKGDEPVRRQRAVTSLGAVAADDGSVADPLYEKAVEVVRTHRRVSVSLVQRHLVVGYNRAARLIEAMEVAGVVSVARSNGSRDLIATQPA
jgi:recombination associated protein RdgC